MQSEWFSLTRRNRVVLGKLAVTQIVQKFQVIYGTGRLITMFTRAGYWSLS
jgi:hypothetical protein